MDEKRMKIDNEGGPYLIESVLILSAARDLTSPVTPPPPA